MGHFHNSIHNLDSAITDLVEQIALGRGCSDPLQAALIDLEPLFCDYLYTVWSRSPEYSRSQPEELAYLAHVGASLIVDALAGHIPQQMADTVVDQLHSQVQKDQLSQGLVGQPRGFFRPFWSLHFSYAMSFLLESANREEFDLTPITLNESTRGTLLQCGAVYRVIQAYMDNAGMEESWLDEYLTTDIGYTVAQLFAGAGEEYLASWPAPQQHAWLVCANPEAGVGLALEALTKIPETDSDEEVISSIGLAFLGVGSPGSTWPVYVRGLLTTQPLQRIRQSPACYGELILRLGVLLLQSAELDDELAQDAREIVFEIPAAEPNADELIAIKADVMSQLTGLGFDLEEVVGWIERVATSEDLPLAAVRGALRPFIRLWDHYSPEVREVLSGTLLSIGESPKYSKLWESQRIIRMQSS